MRSKHASPGGTSLLSLALSLLLLALGPQQALAGAGTNTTGAAEASAILAQKHACLACHQGVRKGNGPPYKEVAAKYAGNKHAEAILAKHIRHGTGPDGLGWQQAGLASLPFMPPNSGLNQAQARQLARWVLATSGEIPDIARLFVTEKITISGAVEHKLQLDVAALRQLPQQRFGETAVVCQSGAERGRLENYQGVLLRDILDKAKILAPGHDDVKKLAIIASASDGYKAVFSWNEIFNSPLGDGVLVFFEKNGQLLGEDEGRIAMVSAKDSRTGPRHVKWLQDIEVRRIAD